MVDIQDLRPYFMRLFPSARRRLALLPHTRKLLQDDLRAFINSVGECSTLTCFRPCVFSTDEISNNLSSQCPLPLGVKGPAMGEIYYGKNLDWKAILQKSGKAKKSV